MITNFNLFEDSIKLTPINIICIVGNSKFTEGKSYPVYDVNRLVTPRNLLVTPRIKTFKTKSDTNIKINIYTDKTILDQVIRGYNNANKPVNAPDNIPLYCTWNSHDANAIFSAETQEQYNRRMISKQFDL